MLQILDIISHGVIAAMIDGSDVSSIKYCRNSTDPSGEAAINSNIPILDIADQSVIIANKAANPFATNLR